MKTRGKDRGCNSKTSAVYNDATNNSRLILSKPNNTIVFKHRGNSKPYPNSETLQNYGFGFGCDNGTILKTLSNNSSSNSSTHCSENSNIFQRSSIRNYFRNHNNHNIRTKSPDSYVDRFKRLTGTGSQLHMVGQGIINNNTSSSITKKYSRRRHQIYYTGPAWEVPNCDCNCDVRSRRRCRLFLSVLLVTLLTVTLFVLYRNATMPIYRLIERDIFSIVDLQPHKCNYPRLNPFNPQILEMVKINESSSTNYGNCSFQHNGVEQSFVADHQFLYKTAELTPKVFYFNERHYDATPRCCYQPFYRTNDAHNWKNPKCIEITENITRISEEFIELFCKMPVFNLDYYDMFAFIPEKPEVEDRIAKINQKSKSKLKSQTNPNNTNNKNDSLSLSPPPEEKLSVIIFGMDSVSHMNFIRLMPKTHRYLVERLHAVPLHGYTKVAENTLPNIIPLLSGLTLREFKSLCVREFNREPPSNSQFGPFGFNLNLNIDLNKHLKHLGLGRDEEIPPDDDELNNNFASSDGKVHLDKCPFIWKTFSSKGYRTSYGEDQNHIGIFNMYWGEAFDHQPTDYYLRTLTRQMETTLHSGQCLGTRPSFKVLLDNVLNMAEAFRDRLYFQFTWSTRLSHDRMELLQLGDDDFLSTLEILDKSGNLNNSVLIILSDHGSRSDHIRSTPQGQQEDRMPLAYIRPPSWFNTSFPKAMKNLWLNSHRLSTPFDMHQTLYEFMDLTQLKDETIRQRTRILKHERKIKGNDRNLYQSLFLEISETRTCFQAGIPLHWCLCHVKEPISNYQEDPDVKSAVNYTLDLMNKLVATKSNRCSHLTLVNIINALKWKGEKVRGRQKNSNKNSSKKQSRDDNKRANYTVNNNNNNSEDDDDLKDVMILEISFTTEPGEGTFEATVVKLPSDGSWSLTERVVRTNSYGDQSDCVDDHDIKEYCYCDPNFEYLMKK